MITIRLGQQTLEGGSRAAAVTLWWMEEVAPTGDSFHWGNTVTFQVLQHKPTLANFDCCRRFPTGIGTSGGCSTSCGRRRRRRRRRRHSSY